MAVDALRERHLTPFRLAVLYAVFGLLALVGSDILLLALFEDPLLRILQAGKGAIEVLVTAGLIYVVVRSTWRELLLKERAIEAAPIGITMSDPATDDNPLIFANRHFEELTGYEEGDVVGRNCRFLQGDDTDPETRADIRTAIDDERPVSVDIVNYRKNGSRFWNKVDIAPVRDSTGTVTNFVGFQADITERKIRAERLEVLNRVMRHNFRNKMNVILGYVELLRDQYDGEPPGAMDRIERATSELLSLTETARRNESIIRGTTDESLPVRLDERLPELVGAVRDRYPTATIDLDVAGPVEAEAAGLLAAIEEAVENAIKHNDKPEPAVTVRVESLEDGWVAIEIEDNGPGIPGPEVEVLAEGETPLKHADRLGIWSIYWTVVRAGGRMEITQLEDEGSVLSLLVPGGESCADQTVSSGS